MYAGGGDVTRYSEYVIGYSRYGALQGKRESCEYAKTALEVRPKIRTWAPDKEGMSVKHDKTVP